MGMDISVSREEGYLLCNFRKNNEIGFMLEDVYEIYHGGDSVEITKDMATDIYNASIRQSRKDPEGYSEQVGYAELIQFIVNGGLKVFIDVS